MPGKIAHTKRLLYSFSGHTPHYIFNIYPMNSSIKFFLIAVLFSPIIFAQTKKVENDKLTIKYLNTREVSKTFHLNSSTRIKSDQFYKIKVSCKLRSKEKGLIDINKFSLIDKANKIRYRPTDISFQAVVGYMAYWKLLKEDTEQGGALKDMMGVAYDPENIDSFNDFDIENYSNIELPVNLGTKKNPILRTIYFQNHKVKNFRALFFFPILNKTEKEPEFEILYGNEIISQIEH